MVPRAAKGRRTQILAFSVAVGLILSACQIGGSSSPPTDVTPITDQNASTTSAPTSSAASTPQVAPATTVAPDSLASNSTPGPTGSVEVSPGDVALGGVVLSLSVQTAQPMYDPSHEAAPNGNPDQANEEKNKPRGLAVLGGQALQLTNNFDPSQNPPADGPKEMLRHLALQVKDKNTGQLVPHLLIGIDLLRDGRPVLQDQALVPMVQTGGNASQMHYGNNVKFPGPGEYQVFVRVQPSPLLESGSTGVAQFNISIK